MALLPPEYGSLSDIVTIALLLVDGAIIGVAVKKGLTSVILLAVGLLLAGFAGLTLPFSLTAGDIITHATNIFISQIRHVGGVFSVFPIAWLLGFALGIWKG
jgi:hypothetical protein